MPHRSTPRSVLVTLLALACAVLVTLARPRAARAEPWFGWGQGAVEERYENGDIDADDLLAQTTPNRRTVGAETSRRESWVSLGVLYTVLRDGSHELGGMVVAGIALDRMAQGNVHRAIDPPLLERIAYDPSAIALPPSVPPRAGAVVPILPPPSPAPSPPPAPPSPAPPPKASCIALALTPEDARRAVASAWRTSGLGVDDARIDAMIARARASALLPEMRLRAMRVLDDTSKVDAIPDTTGTYLAVGANLWLEARLTWRLDRIVFADDEPTLERVRIERHDARTRVAAKVIEALFLWQRATVRAARAAPESQEKVEATLQAAEASSTLDVLTGGWFETWRASQEPPR